MFHSVERETSKILLLADLVLLLSEELIVFSYSSSADNWVNNRVVFTFTRVGEWPLNRNGGSATIIHHNKWT